VRAEVLDEDWWWEQEAEIRIDRISGINRIGRIYGDDDLFFMRISFDCKNFYSNATS